MAVVTATIGKHPERSGVWCVFVPCSACGIVPGTVYVSGSSRTSGHSGYQTCSSCAGSGKRILSTHSTRDGAAVSANQINRAEAGR